MHPQMIESHTFSNDSTHSLHAFSISPATEYFNVEKRVLVGRQRIKFESSHMHPDQDTDH
jgi:hypothetical protein